MSDSISYLEFTSFSESNPQGYDDEPLFDAHIWPLFIERSASIAKVCLFVNSHWSGHGRLLEAGRKVDSHLTDLGQMRLLTEKQLIELNHLSFFGGHLSVFYLINIADDLLKKLQALWQRRPTLSSGTGDLGLTENESSALAGLIQGLGSDQVLVSFGHDADPMYIFGPLSALQWLLDHA
jgi:hypothetical protein